MVGKYFTSVRTTGGLVRWRCEGIVRLSSQYRYGGKHVGLEVTYFPKTHTNVGLTGVTFVEWLDSTLSTALKWVDLTRTILFRHSELLSCTEKLTRHQYQSIIYWILFNHYLFITFTTWLIPSAATSQTKQLQHALNCPDWHCNINSIVQKFTCVSLAETRPYSAVSWSICDTANSSGWWYGNILCALFQNYAVEFEWLLK